jgi:hypothetical protein
MNYSNGNMNYSSGNINVPTGGFGSVYNMPMKGGFAEQNNYNNQTGFNSPPPPSNQPQNYNTNFNPFDILGKRV